MAQDSPMAKRDKHGNIITAPEAIKNLYIDTYKERLQNRRMKSEPLDIYFLKSELWEYRNEELVKKQSNPWTPKNWRQS